MMTEAMILICAWCPKDKQIKAPVGTLSTHGICPECFARENAKMDAHKALKRTAN